MRRAWAAAVAGVRLLKEHRLPRYAAALTYHLVVAIFPILMVVTALLGPDGRDDRAVRVQHARGRRRRCRPAVLPRLGSRDSR